MRSISPLRSFSVCIKITQPRESAPQHAPAPETAPGDAFGLGLWYCIAMWISHCLVNIENEACGLRRTADCVQLDERNSASILSSQTC
ncbi:hypothetical protein BDR06DRAFT_960027 [Suillus hirtellus]|nr:hypothetical protein BDR06DRAFT_960027 [Suillus hirtellus]